MTFLPFASNDRYPPLAALQAETAVSDLHQCLTQLIETKDEAWLIQQDEELVGYATLSSVPGLPNVADPNIFIRLSSRRQRIGSAALAHLAQAAQKRGFTQLSYGLTDLQTTAARFLQQHNFAVEHEEQVLWLDDLRPFRTPPTLPPTHSLVTFGWKTAVFHFLTLYDASFTPHPWYQPYTADEVEAMLVQPEDLLFLCRQGQPVGVSWLHLAGETGRIEPVGLLPSVQGQGNGRLLLQASLHRLAHRQVKKVRIGAWVTNTAALTLYTSLRFQPTQTTIYFAKSLPISN